MGVGHPKHEVDFPFAPYQIVSMQELDVATHYVSTRKPVVAMNTEYTTKARPCNRRKTRIETKELWLRTQERL